MSLGCPKNSKYARCEDTCPLTCENYPIKPKVCTLICIEGCNCKEGYIKLESRSSKCVRLTSSECQRRRSLRRGSSGRRTFGERTNPLISRF